MEQLIALIWNIADDVLRTCWAINQAALLCLCHRGYALHLKIM